MAVWTRSSGYPKRNISAGGTTYTDQYYSTADDTSGLPAVNSSYSTDSEAKLITVQIEPDVSGKLFYATLQYGQSAQGENNVDDDDPVYSLSVGMLEFDISRHADYRTKWNWHLASRSDYTGSTPSWHATATTTQIIAQDKQYFKWCKDGEIPTPEGSKTWSILSAMTKPGQETFSIPSTIVNEKRWYKTKSSGSRAALDVGKLKEPREKFGVSGGEWLVMPATLEPDGKRWLLTVSYQWAPDWDDDLYDEA